MARSRVEWIKLWQARIRDFEPEVETQGARADDRMVIIAERSGRVMLHFCSLTLVRTVLGALAQTTFYLALHYVYVLNCAYSIINN